MPIASGNFPSEHRSLNPHLLAVNSLSRNDSLKSERSDKRVSFNNDVGVKHIPRGAANKQHSAAPAQKSPPDEWAVCKPVRLQPNNLSAAELEKEAANLVDLVDSINCKSSPLPKKHKDFVSRSLDRSQKHNNSQVIQPNGLNYTRITNPIIRHLKADVNRREARKRDIYTDSDSDRNISSHRHKSVPNLLAPTCSNGHRSGLPYNGIEKRLNYTSVDNLLDEKNTNIIHEGKQPKTLYNSHHSAENLLETNPASVPLLGYKSLGALASFSDSDSTDLSHTYRPKVNSIIQKLNADADTDYRSTDLNNDRDLSNTRGVIVPTKLQNHNNNRPFSYTGSTPVSSLQAVRQISPPREPVPEGMYAQVNKHGLRQRLSMESDYSAKIIITEEKPRRNYDEPDDDVYETYQVQGNSMHNGRISDFGLNLSRDLNFKNNAMNNNINMSSVAVQTDSVSKSINKDRRHMKGIAPSPPVNDPFISKYQDTKTFRTDLHSADLVRQVNHGFGRVDRSPSPPPRRAMNRKNPRHVVPLLSDTSDSEPEYRRRADPLAKIRNQVKMGERLQEDREEEEWQEREMARYEKDKRNSSYNHSSMRPLTVDEVDALSLEVDQHGSRKLVVSQKSSEKRSLSQQTTQQTTQESYGERSYSEDRSRPLKSQRDRIEGNRDSSSSRQRATPDRNKKNNLEKEKNTKEIKEREIERENEKKREKDTLKLKAKDKKSKDTKEKKKKLIKIKFFYDPRPQDKSEEDPLKRFTEYKGTNYKEKHEKNATHTTRSRSEDSRSQSRERRNLDDISKDPRYIRDSSRDRSLSRPERNRVPFSSNSRHHVGRSASGNERSSHDDSNDDRRRMRSTESHDKHNRTENRVEFNREERRKYEYDNHYDRPRRGYDSVDDPEKINEYNSRNENNHNERSDDYNDMRTAAERRTTVLELRESYEERDANVVRSQSSAVKRRDSYKDHRSLAREDESDRPRHYNNYHSATSPDEEPSRLEDKYISSPDDDEKQERVLRQRKKFLTALIGDGRAKGSAINTTTKMSSSATTTKTLSNNISSTAVKRSESSPQGKPGKFSASSNVTNNKLVTDSDTQPPPSVTSTNKVQAGENRLWSARSHDQRETRQWESATLQRPPRQNTHDRQPVRSTRPTRRTSDGSSASSAAPPISRVGRTTSFKQRYFGDSDNDRVNKTRENSGPGDYRSLPARTTRTTVNKRGVRGGGGGGSAGSSLQSSESENDSHHGSRASHVSTGSNRSVYLHATAVADIPVQKGEESDRSVVQRQTRKVSRSFSLLAPWRPRHPRENQQIDYDNRDKEPRHDNRDRELRQAAKPPRPPRRSTDQVDRTNTLTHKDSKLSGWLKKRRSKEGKGI